MAETQKTDQSQPQSTLDFRAATVPDRLSMSTSARITCGIIGGALTGLFLGLSRGSTMAGMVFRAENAHRFPTTQKGWYLYHKSKNYHAMIGGLKDGMKVSRQLGFLAGCFFCTEAAVDAARGNKDFASTAVAGSILGCGFSVYNRFPLETTVRTVKMGLYRGLFFGLAQDILIYARGGRLRYVDFVLAKFRGSPPLDKPETSGLSTASKT